MRIRACELLSGDRKHAVTLLKHRRQSTGGTAARDCHAIHLQARIPESTLAHPGVHQLNISSFPRPENISILAGNATRPAMLPENRIGAPASHVLDPMATEDGD